MNRVYLVNHAEASPLPLGAQRGHWLLGAHAQIPILWLALFRSEHVCTVHVPFTDAEQHETLEVVPTLFAQAPHAKACYAQRKEALLAALGTQYTQYIHEWEYFLANQIVEPFLQIELTELWMMDQPEYFAEDLQIYMHGIDHPQSSEWDELCGQAGLAEPEIAPNGLRGFAWEASVNWE